MDTVIANPAATGTGVQNPLNPIMLKEYIAQKKDTPNKIVAISDTVLRSKENRYPFIVLRDAQGVEESIFFTKNLSEEFAGKEVIDTRELGTCFVITVSYEDGRATRHKLSRSGNMASIDDFEWK